MTLHRKYHLMHSIESKCIGLGDFRCQHFRNYAHCNAGWDDVSIIQFYSRFISAMNIDSFKVEAFFIT